MLNTLPEAGYMNIAIANHHKHKNKHDYEIGHGWGDGTRLEPVVHAHKPVAPEKYITEIGDMVNPWNRPNINPGSGHVFNTKKETIHYPDNWPF